MRIGLVLAGLAFAIGTVGMAHGASDVIKERQALMRANGGAAKTLAQMVQGKTPYDAGAAKAAFQKIADDVTKFKTLFPEGSDKGKTDASPDIWKNKADFDALADKTVADATAGAAAAGGGVDAIKSALGAVGGDCQSCHQKYRAKT